MRRAAFLPIALVAAALAACSGTSSSSPTFAGRWLLQTVNGSPLPFTSDQTATTKNEIVSDVIDAAADGGFTDTMTVRSTVGGQATTAVNPRSGIWVVEGSTVTFTFFDDGLSTTASFDGKSLTAAASGRSYVYARH